MICPLVAKPVVETTVIVAAGSVTAPLRSVANPLSWK
jgi:hypothetical protein